MPYERMKYDYSLPFDWNKCFVPDKLTDCMPSCVAMACRYWKLLKPELPIPMDLEVWKKFVSDLKGNTMRGTSVTRVMTNLAKILQSNSDAENIVIKRHNMLNIEATIEFLKHDPPIPLIIIFDRAYMVTNNEGGYHACLLHGIDYQKEKKIGLIDPSITDMVDPFPWDIERFVVGWGKTQNLCLAIYPPDETPIRTKKGAKNDTLTKHMEGYN